MTLNMDERVHWNQACMAEFVKAHRSKVFSSAEFDLMHKWQSLGVSLGTVLQGIREAGGHPRTLHACQQSVEANVARQKQALTELPPAMELEESWDAAKVANERQRIFAKHGRAK